MVEIIWDGGATLGEGPVWDHREQRLWFVDIKEQRVHRLDPATRDRRSWDAPAMIGWILPAAGGSMLAGLQTGLHRFDPSAGSFTMVAEIEAHLPTNRLNDATTGPDGCVWFGSMDDNAADKTGQVYRWDGEAASPVDIPLVCITNGPAISPNGATLYHVDTAGGIIHEVALDKRGGIVSQRDFVTIAPDEGQPDGVTVDSAGNVWVGIWEGGCARCYSPEGKLVRQVDLPATNITKVALGGPDGRTAYATSARIGLSDAVLDREPNAGAIFAFEVEVPGQSYPLARI